MEKIKKALLVITKVDTSIRIEKTTVAMIRGFKATTTPSRGATSEFVIIHYYKWRKEKKWAYSASIRFCQSSREPTIASVIPSNACSEHLL